MADHDRTRAHEARHVSANQIDVHQLRDVALEIAREAAAMVLERHGERHDADTKASDLDLVTEIDRASERLITERLQAARPGDGIVGEEGASIASSTGVEWLVDPIDGTTSFFYGLPGFSVSIGARFDDEIVAGAVVAPVIGAEYTAAKGDGAKLNGRPIEARDTTELAQALVGTGFHPVHERRVRQGVAFAQLIPQIRDIRRMGSAALELCSVAAGQLDAFFETGLSRWDYAAGWLIATEAGAQVVIEHDDEGDRAFVFAAAPAIADDLLTVLRGLDAHVV